ncbi:hypothetical protein [Microbacterium sp. SORGH_AS_0454]|uniref:hypothetical protein n=1 Tax=Microbacterium sp. SORGH_AS_0454 TaxID=3041758 RepID=UPI00286CCC42|nr:hypothetical protein [Microbacterium sp. SORGH_AS_0454]
MAITGLLIGGAALLVGGTMLTAIKGSQIIGMGVQVFGAWFSYVPIFTEATPKPIPGL